MESIKGVVWLMTCSITLQITASVIISCGENLCLCDDNARSASCQPEQGRPVLPFFPKLPDYIMQVTFKDFIHPAITRKDLTNLTYLSLKYLRLEHMNITYMEEGLFRSFSKLRVLNISNNGYLSSVTLRQAFQSISVKLETLVLNSNNLTHVVSDMFRHLMHTDLQKLILIRNPLLNLKQDIFENMNLTTLDLSFSGISDLRVLCPKQSPYLLTNLRVLKLQSTNTRTLPRNFMNCFPNLQKLYLDDNKLDSLPQLCETYNKSQNSTNKLQELYLQNTGLEGNISDMSSLCLDGLTILDLGRNKLTSVPNFCHSTRKSVVPSLKQLKLQYTSILILQEHSFQCLSSLRILDLRNNILKDLPNFCRENNVSYTPKLAMLYLRNTSIITLNDYRFGCLWNLKELDLRYNYFKQIPSFCDKSNKSTNPSLEKLDLSWNSIQFIFPDSFRCLSSLITLRLSYILISKLDDNIFSPLTSLKNLEIGYSRDIRNITKYAFNITNLTTLKFVYNDFEFADKTRYSPEHLFKYCENVETLILSGNHFPTNRVAQRILKPLKKLQHLSLAENRMHTINEKTFQLSRTLKTLLLDHNRLTGWNERVFENLPELTFLKLAFNKIAVFNKTSVPIAILNKLKIFDLSYNPFNCGCNMMWFKNWSLTTNVTLLSFPRMYSCLTPSNMFRKSLLSLHLTEEDCKEKNTWLIVILSASAGVLILMCAIITISVQMPTIKNYMYYLRLSKMGYIKLINEQEFPYDSYIVYCESNEKWVLRTLVPTIEFEGFRVCIPDREFDIGADKCDQIESAFKESRKIIVVLSNDFAKNEWCLWQMNLVEERLRQSGNSAAIFVLYKSISSKNMISSLHRTLKKRDILTWYEGGSREKMFWKIIVMAMKAPLGEPPVSVVQ
uniref:Toll-like receptor 13 n=1 Tax=Crassostrea virginica TaxID=6565 RepID=A0A8B8AGV2_CRAVI|nr:toll-like receptor 13 [Crassostrea virginica]